LSAIINTLRHDNAWRASLAATAESAAQKPLDDSEASLQKVKEQKSELSGLGVPIGWSAAAVPNTFNGWVTKIIGLIFTIVAVSHGAPF
jgi:hypothetical protein